MSGRWYLDLSNEDAVHNWAENSLREAIELIAGNGRNDLASDLNRILANVEFEDMEILRTSGADEFADRIVDTESLPDLVEVLNHLTRQFDVAHSTLHVISDSSTMNFRTRVITTYPEEWISRYVDRRYSLVDPVADACSSYGHGFYWDSLIVSNPAARAFQADACEFGVGPSGYSLPIGTESGDLIALTVCSSESPDVFSQRFARYESDLYNLGCLLIDAFCRLASDRRPASFTPTDDQVMVLRKIAMGADEEELEALHFQYGSYRTMEASICRLFETRTVFQAAVLAAKIGLLDCTPLMKGDVFGAGGRPESSPTVAPNIASLRRIVRKRRSADEGSGPNVISLTRHAV